MAAASIYQPLDPSRQQIRLIEIAPFDPRDKSAVIDCKLHVVSLLDQPQFAALSYVWGDPSVTTEILVDGAPFRATVNLAAALRQAFIHAPFRAKVSTTANLRQVAIHEPVHIQQEEVAWFKVKSNNDDDGNEDTFDSKHDGASAWSDWADCYKQLRLWADAICINQEDMDEKNHQIPLMRSIYSGARLVIGSLGHGDDDELDMGMQTLDDICRAYAREIRRQWKSSDNIDDELDRLDELFGAYARLNRRRGKSSDNNDGHGLPTDDDSSDGDFEWMRSLPHLFDAHGTKAEALARWNALGRLLLYHPYFKRVWIIQEMVLARSAVFVSDHRSIDLGAHAKTAKEFINDQKVNGFFSRPRPRFVSAENWLFFRLLDPFFSRLASIGTLKDCLRVRDAWKAQVTGLRAQATDKRDHVYGVLGISGFGIRVDYEQSVGEVYADMVMACIQDGAIRHLDEFLAFAGAGLVGCLADVPSWTPSPYMLEVDMCNDVLDATIGVFEETAPGSAVRRVKYTPSDLELSLRGIRLEEVVQKRDIPHFIQGADDQERLGFMEHVLNWKSVMTGIQGASRADAFVYTLFPQLYEMLSWSEPEPEPKSEVIGEEPGSTMTYSAAVAFLLSSMLDPKAEWKDGRPQYKSDRHKELYGRLVDELGVVASPVGEVDYKLFVQFQCLVGRCLFETDRGNLGRGPQGSRPGDVVCLLEGCRLPALLRRCDGGRYVHVGLCNIPSLLGGKVASELVAKGDVAVEEFVLV